MTDGIQGTPGTPGTPPPPAKKGMSKGCLISLIVAGVILVIIVALMVTCYFNQDKIAKSLTSYTVNQMKEMIVKTPPPGIDTAQFNSLADNFVKRLETDTLDMTKFQSFFQSMQEIPGDGKIDSLEAEQLMQSIYQFYPDLKPAPEESMESTTPEDSTGM